jgi:hypothetical protein
MSDASDRTSSNPTAVMVTFSAPAEGATDEAFNAWYDGEHVPAILQHVEGISRVSRFRVSGDPTADGPASLPYLAIYEFDRPPGEVLANFAAAEDHLAVSDALNVTDRPPVSAVYEFVASADRTERPAHAS